MKKKTQPFANEGREQKLIKLISFNSGTGRLFNPTQCIIHTYIGIYKHFHTYAHRVRRTRY